jgi:hypothetical protein
LTVSDLGEENDYLKYDVCDDFGECAEIPENDEIDEYMEKSMNDDNDRE